MADNANVAKSEIIRSIGAIHVIDSVVLSM